MAETKIFITFFQLSFSKPVLNNYNLYKKLNFNININNMQSREKRY